MTKSIDLPDILPVFPLPGALLLPRSRLPLHLFEPRYLQMLEDVMKTSHRLIGMIQPYDAPGQNGKLHSIGCSGRLTAFSETEDGRYMNMLGRFFDDRGLSTDWDSLQEAEDELLINSLSMLCPFDPEDKQALLEAPSLSTRRETLVTLIEFALRGGTNDEVMQ
jgi:Lon protease-like protein